MPIVVDFIVVFISVLYLLNIIYYIIYIILTLICNPTYDKLPPHLPHQIHRHKRFPTARRGTPPLVPHTHAHHSPDE